MLSVYSWKKSINNVDIMLLLYWWILPQVFEAMFRVIKESEYVDERQHCFLIQVDLTQCGLKDIQKDLIENLIHSKRLNYSVCQANRHFLCRVYVAMHVSTRTWKRARTNLFTCRAPSWMGTAALLRAPPSPLPATKSWENHRDLAKNLKSRSPCPLLLLLPPLWICLTFPSLPS